MCIFLMVSASPMTDQWDITSPLDQQQEVMWGSMVRIPGPTKNGTWIHGDNIIFMFIPKSDCFTMIQFDKSPHFSDGLTPPSLEGGPGLSF